MLEQKRRSHPTHLMFVFRIAVKCGALAGEKFFSYFLSQIEVEISSSLCLLIRGCPTRHINARRDNLLLCDSTGKICRKRKPTAFYFVLQLHVYASACLLKTLVSEF